jgi:hypothetical protein
MAQNNPPAKHNMLRIYREPGLNSVLTVPCYAFRFIYNYESDSVAETRRGQTRTSHFPFCASNHY